MDSERGLPGGGPATPGPGERSVTAFCSRHYAVLAAVVLGLAAFNLTYRLGGEIVTQWDESLYAISAWEMSEGGNWIATTFLRSLDYYNTKPPLNVWLIALAFKAFGRSLVSLRLASVVAAWLTIAVLMSWSRRCFDAAVSLTAGLVLATTFGFLYVHAGRSANTDAVFTLLVLLTVVALWAARDRPWQIAWLGPIAAATFLLRGMGMLLPLAIVLAVGLLWRRRSIPWLPIGLAVLLFVGPVTAWIAARWYVDEWRFLERLFLYDFVARSVRVIERHPGTPLYYVNILLKHQYDWILAALVTWLLAPVSWQQVRRAVMFWRDRDDLRILVACWAGTTLLIPTVMVTKLPWYLNPFYPVFALGISWILVHGFSHARTEPHGRWRGWALGLVVVVLLAVAESKLIWYSYHYRTLRGSVQELLLKERRILAKQTVFSSRWDYAELFVLGGIIGGEGRLAAGPADFWRQSRPGDYLVSRLDYSNSGLVMVGSNRRYRLYYRPK